MNALRHGLTRQLEMIDPEEKEAKDEFSTAIISSLAPEPGLEFQLALAIADGQWRLNRASTVECNIFTLAASFESDDDGPLPSSLDKAFATTRAFEIQSKTLQLLTVYEQRIHRMMQKNVQLLNQMQTTRRALWEKEQAEQREIAEKARRIKADAAALRERALNQICILSQMAEAQGRVFDPAEFPDPNGFVFSPAEIAVAVRRDTLLQAAEYDSFEPDSTQPLPIAA